MTGPCRGVAATLTAQTQHTERLLAHHATPTERHGPHGVRGAALACLTTDLAAPDDITAATTVHDFVETLLAEDPPLVGSTSTSP